MNKTKQMRLTLAKLLTLYRELPTDEGVTLVSENDFALGSEIFVLTESGEIETAPDGIYHTETATYTVADGIIASIEEHNTVEVVEVEEPIEDPSLVDSELEIIRKRLQEAEKTIEDRDREIVNLKESLDSANKTIEALNQQIKDLLGKSGKPVVEETIEEEETEKTEEFKKQQRKNAGVELIKKYRK